MHFEPEAELNAGNADVLVRIAPIGRVYLFIGQIANRVDSRFALSADEDVRVPSKVKLANRNCTGTRLSLQVYI